MSSEDETTLSDNGDSLQDVPGQAGIQRAPRLFRERINPLITQRDNEILRK